MAVDIQKQLKKIWDGKYSAFLALFELVNQEVWDFFSDKTGENQSLTEYLHTRCMDRLFVAWTKEEVQMLATQEEFLQSARVVAERLWTEYEQVLSDKSQTSDYFSQLKLKFKAKLQANKVHNPKFLAYYLHYFRFYFTGGVFVVGIGLLAFLFWFLTLQKSPLLLSNPKIFTHTGDQAFWLLSGVQDFSREMSIQTGSFWMQRGTGYAVSAKQLPSLPQKINVAREKTGVSVAFPLVARSLNLPAVKREVLKNYNLSSAEFGTWNRNVRLDLKENSLSMYFGWDRASLPIKDGYASSEGAIKKKIKSQISAFWLSLANYGELQLRQEGEVVYGFFPRLFDGKPIYESSSRISPVRRETIQLGMMVEYHLPSETLISLNEYSFQQYLTSKYPVLEQDALLKKAEKIWLLLDAKLEDGVVALPKGKIVYLAQEEDLLPVVMRDVDGKQYFVSLVEEK